LTPKSKISSGDDKGTGESQLGKRNKMDSFSYIIGRKVTKLKSSGNGRRNR